MASLGEISVYAAAANGILADVIRLCEDTNSVNACNSFGWTPLMYGVYYGHIDVVNALLSLGADADAKNYFGGSVMTLAAGSGNVEVIRAVNRCCSAPSESGTISPLAMAALRGHLSVVRFLIDNGADPDLPMEHSGVVPLMLAVVENHIEVVKLLILRGADISRKNHAGYSALKLAVLSENHEILSFFNEKLGNGIDSIPVYMTCTNKEAVVQASKNGDLFRLKNLLSQNPSLSTSHHWTTNVNGQYLMTSAQGENDDVFVISEMNVKHTEKAGQRQRFCQLGFPELEGEYDLFGLCHTSYDSSYHYDPYQSNKHKSRSYGCASVCDGGNLLTKNHLRTENLSSVEPHVNSGGAYNHEECLDEGQSSSSNKSGIVKCETNGRIEGEIAYSPLILACINGHVEAAHLLIGAGADPNRQRKGRTPLMVAAITLNVELAKLLFTAGADPLAESNVDSLTAFELASLSGADTELLRLLALHTLPISFDGFHTASPKLGPTPNQDCWISPHRVLNKLQAVISPRIQNTSNCWDSKYSTNFKKLKHWKTVESQNFKQSWKTKPRRLFSTPGSAKKSKPNPIRFQQGNFPIYKPHKRLSKTCNSYCLTHSPFDTPFDALVSDCVSLVKPPAFLQCNEPSFKEVTQNKKPPNTDMHSTIDQNECQRNKKNVVSQPQSALFNSGNEVPYYLRQVTSCSPGEESYDEKYRNSLVSPELQENTENNGRNFEEYLLRCGLKEYTSLFKDNEVEDIEIILSLTENDLEGMGVPCMEERNKILNKIHNCRLKKS